MKITISNYNASLREGSSRKNKSLALVQMRQDRQELCRITGSSKRNAVLETSQWICMLKRFSACRTSSLGIPLVYQCNNKLNRPTCRKAHTILRRNKTMQPKERVPVRQLCQMQTQKRPQILTPTRAVKIEKTHSIASIIDSLISASKTLSLARSCLRFSATEDSKASWRGPVSILCLLPFRRTSSGTRLFSGKDHRRAQQLIWFEWNNTLNSNPIKKENTNL